MLYLWPASKYWWYALYIGGDTAQYVAHCSFPNANWLNTVNGYGWRFVFIWDGLQAPGCGNTYAFSTNTTTAYDQGEQMASEAYNTLVYTDGVSNFAANTVVVDDLEGYNLPPGNGCVSPYPYQSAVTAFISGWDYTLHNPTAQTYGVYGSGCASNLSDLAHASTVPEFIWGATWDNNPSTTDIGCVSSGEWVYNQRLKQYDHEVNVYSGGPSPYENGIVVDEDCANGPTSPVGVTGDNC